VNIALSAEVFVGQYLQADDEPTVVEHHPSGQVVEGGDEGFELERSTEQARRCRPRTTWARFPFEASGGLTKSTI